MDDMRLATFEPITCASSSTFITEGHWKYAELTRGTNGSHALSEVQKYPWTPTEALCPGSATFITLDKVRRRLCYSRPLVQCRPCNFDQH